MMATTAGTPPAPVDPAHTARVRRGRRRAVRGLAGVVAALAVAALAVIAVLRIALGRSLPAVDGRVVLPGLSAPVRVERDGLGVPTLRARTRTDLARATGFVQAQERFFQMDLTRRRAAGELAELFGPVAVSIDRSVRVHRLRSVAQQAIAEADPHEKELALAYTEGVNAGLEALGCRPFEYILLRARPVPWKAEDTVLVALAMFLELQDEDGSFESAAGLVHELPEPLAEFLNPGGTEWDAPLLGPPFETSPIPGPDVIDLRRRAALLGRSVGMVESGLGSRPENDEERAGSNNWAVAGSRTTDGRAILANDMHLGLSVPNTWYRASFEWTDDPASLVRHTVTGVTLPGAPAMIVGSNGAIAWGFTNAMIDTSDLIVIEPDPANTNAYMTRDGPRAYGRSIERIAVKGGPDESLTIKTTIWGPVIDTDADGRARALRWVAHDPHAVNLRLTRMEDARSLDEALALAPLCGAPAQNLVVADRAGRIGWTLCGILPRRKGFDGRLPGSWAKGDRGWDGWLEAREYPKVVDPPSGIIWTANARVVGGEDLARIGDGGYVLGARARQIRDALTAMGPAAGERDMLGLQLDDRALFLERWRRVLSGALTPEAVAGHPRRAELRSAIDRGWDGHASTGSAAYRLVRAFRLAMTSRVLAPLLEPCTRRDARFSAGSLWQTEGPVWKILEERPAHLLDPRFASWDAEILSAVDEILEPTAAPESSRSEAPAPPKGRASAVPTAPKGRASAVQGAPGGRPSEALAAKGGQLSRVPAAPGGRLSERTWGERNTARIQHPLSRALPWLARWLDMPTDPLPGDNYMPRVQSPTFGASERMVVSPGHEADGIFEMPCGQSGHPLSPHYRDGHAAWVRGEPTPFLPGPPVHTLELVPGP